MYISRKEHYLSNSIIFASIVHTASNLMKFAVRAIVRENESSLPDMADSVIWRSNALASWLELCLISLFLFTIWKELKKKLSLVKEGDQLQMAVLQQEILGKNTPTLMGDTIYKLLQLWACILIGARFIYYICSNVYRNFITELGKAIALENGLTSDKFVSMYNNSHGFTYIGLLIAIQLGVITSGIFLNDRLLKLAPIVLMSFFLVSFVILGMQTVTIHGYSIGIVWTSVIFHLVETIGLFTVGMYLRKHYVGL